jgi:hypothetical protein
VIDRDWGEGADGRRCTREEMVERKRREGQLMEEDMKGMIRQLNNEKEAAHWEGAWKT